MIFHPKKVFHQKSKQNDSIERFFFLRCFNIYRSIRMFWTVGMIGMIIHKILFEFNIILSLLIVLNIKNLIPRKKPAKTQVECVKTRWCDTFLAFAVRWRVIGRCAYGSVESGILGNELDCPRNVRGVDWLKYCLWLTVDGNSFERSANFDSLCHWVFLLKI